MLSDDGLLHPKTAAHQLDNTGVDLSFTNLAGMNLTAMNLTAMNLTRANLGGATWTDGRICAEGSMGQCD